jgi:patatin-like phospholipase/acyl hydrolase
MILQHIMTKVKKQQQLPTIPLPCTYFDLICGTSTGGLIALMLGRLRMVITIKDLQVANDLVCDRLY